MSSQPESEWNWPLTVRLIESHYRDQNFSAAVTLMEAAEAELTSRGTTKSWTVEEVKFLKKLAYFWTLIGTTRTDYLCGLIAQSEGSDDE